MSKRKQKQFFLSKQAIIGIVIAVVVVGVAIAATIWLFNQQHQAEDGHTGDQATQFVPAQLPKEVNSAQNLGMQGKYGEADQQLHTALDKANSSEDKYNLYLQLGVNYENQKKYDDAKNAYNQALAQQKTDVIYLRLAAVAEAQGQKQQAIDYYKQALPLIQSSDSPVKGAEYQRTEAKIKALGG
jgi:tetratricopeptide (TPR) repeat protein